LAIGHRHAVAVPNTDEAALFSPPFGLHWATAPVGRASERADSPFSPHARTRPKTATGRLTSTDRPNIINEKSFSVFFYYFLMKNTLENVFVVLSAPKIMK
jgi:hypothetical protein